MRLCLMIEGQEGVTWDEWTALAKACEDSGLEALFRSDHYLSFSDPARRGSLDAWATLAGLASITERIKLGTLVSPVTFRHPSNLAKVVATVDHISGGRVELGIGAGWFDDEHRAFGFEFPDDKTRLDMLEEQIEIVNGQWGDDTFSFSGEHYTATEADVQPKPVQRPRPNIIFGGSGGRRSLRLAARWGDEYNTVYADADRCAEIKGRLVDAWDAAGRSSTPVFSLMTGCVVGTDAADLESRVQEVIAFRGESGESRAWIESQPKEWLLGTVEEAADKLGRLADAGVERVMLQHQNHRDIEMVRLLGEQLAAKK